MRYKLFIFFNLGSITGMRSHGNKSRSELYGWDLLIKASDEFKAAELVDKVMAAGRGSSWFLHYYQANSGTVLDVTNRENYEKVSMDFDECLMYRVSGSSTESFQYLLI